MKCGTRIFDKIQISSRVLIISRLIKSGFYENVLSKQVQTEIHICCAIEINSVGTDLASRYVL